MRSVISCAMMGMLVQITANAQTQFLQNPDLENWGQQEVTGIWGPEFIYAPDAWYPFGDLFPYLLGQDEDFNLFQSADAYSGLSSAELRPDSTNTYADIVSIIPAGDQPIALHGYYKMNSNPGDTLRILFSLLDSIPETQQLPIAYSEVFVTQPAADWTEFTATLDYFEPLNIPDSALILIGYTANSYSSGNRVLVDNLWLEYPSGINDREAVTLSVYPNPAADVLHLNAVADIGHVSVFDVLGRHMKTKRVVPGQKLEFDISRWPIGQYSMVFQGRRYGRAEFVKYR